MDIQKGLKSTNNALITIAVAIGMAVVFSIVMTIVMVLAAASITNAGENPEATGNLFAAIGIGGIIVISLFSLAMLAVSIVHLVFYIQATIEANKDTEQTNFILLIVGLFVGIVGIVGLIMFRSRLKELEKEQGQTVNFNEPTY